MDYGRLAANRIEGIEKLKEMPCDMGFVGVDGGDHPFLYAQAGARGEESLGKPNRVPIGGMAEVGQYEYRTEFSLYQNEPGGDYTPHGATYYEDDYPGEEDDWEWTDPDFEDSDSDESSSSSSSSSSDSDAEPVYSSIPIIDAAIKARKWIVENSDPVPGDMTAWFYKGNCQRLGFWRDVVLRQSGADYDANALAALRWGWFHPVRLSPDWEATVLPKDTRLVGRPLVGSYNKTMLLPPPEEGWSEEWQKERDKWQKEHPNEDPEPPPWEGHYDATGWHSADKSLRQKNEFGRSHVIQRAFGGPSWPVEWEWATYETEEEEPEPEESSSSESDGGEFPPDWQEEQDKTPKKVKETVYIGKTALPNPGFENRFRAAEQWAFAPLRECIDGDSIGLDIKIADYDEVYELDDPDGDPEIIEAPDPEEGTPPVGIPEGLEFHTLKKGEYDWRFLCGFTERKKHGERSQEEETHTIRHKFYPLWWSIASPIETPVTPLDDAALMAQISWWAHCVHGIPWGTCIDVRVIAHVYSMKICEAVAHRLRSQGWHRLSVNQGGKTPKNGREWWHTHTTYEVRIRQHLPLK